MSTYNIGQANAQNMAVGDRATVTGGASGVDPLQQLAEAVQQNRDALTDPVQVDQALRQLRALVVDDPDSTEIQPLLGLIISNAQHAPAVLAASAGLQRTAPA